MIAFKVGLISISMKCLEWTIGEQVWCECLTHFTGSQRVLRAPLLGPELTMFCGQCEWFSHFLFNILIQNKVQLYKIGN